MNHAWRLINQCTKLGKHGNLLSSPRIFDSVIECSLPGKSPSYTGCWSTLVIARLRANSLLHDILTLFAFITSLCFTFLDFTCTLYHFIIVMDFKHCNIMYYNFLYRAYDCFLLAACLLHISFPSILIWSACFLLPTFPICTVAPLMFYLQCWEYKKHHHSMDNIYRVMLHYET